MKQIDVTNLDYKTVNDFLRETTEDCTITGCCGHRFIATGMSNQNITINGVPGNALGAYLNGASITVNANAQDAVGDTMNEGQIIIHGDIGDAAGYAMRGGNFPCTGMHGGKMFLRGTCDDIAFSRQVTAACATETDMEEIKEYLSEYCDLFGFDMTEVLNAPFTVITPDSKNPYKQIYVAN